jgi:hypothetical protein
VGNDSFSSVTGQDEKPCTLWRNTHLGAILVASARPIIPVRDRQSRPTMMTMTSAEKLFLDAL